MSNFSLIDQQHMQRALALAALGRYSTTPNPSVGCVIAHGEQVVGEGFHQRAGGPHAEVHALRMAGEQARGATAYVTLEPCSHYGRTPPCAKALVEANVARVVCAMVDPNPQVSGRGLKILSDAGIEVAAGLFEEQAKALNPAFIHRMQTGRPWVQLKVATSLDGKTALANGQSQWITSAEARRDVQAHRAQAGAILSTAKTVIDDNASLNVRRSELPENVLSALSWQPEAALRQPTRILIDSQCRLQSSQSIFQVSSDQSAGDVWLASGQAYPESQTFPDHVSVLEQLARSDKSGQSDTQHIDLAALMAHISAQNINHLWVEAGAGLAGAMLSQGYVDQLIVYMAPKLMGSDGRSLAELTGIASMDQTLNWQFDEVSMIGPDLKIVASPKQ
ncbi:Riboflavin biosynthesis protein RibD [Vibrio stylophorae]|uniref:Riboflavin biosynthesis protein RibD n=1 Tax=Vibrio stylophorae TaxID=659351 RepID=A0ABM8ZRH3_9VIBR|nr:bifunctional diaminohydroxyphosphoribosylaminopyrimidine deaminase/5-amino-6-(5-phosphoribosylamino)uracil reductase RibD [Vibrio stylophorae]CAH0532900.1 Riboflavin biosynthesis protein RibD [Vibrio stylophorae]